MFTFLTPMSDFINSIWQVFADVQSGRANSGGSEEFLIREQCLCASGTVGEWVVLGECWFKSRMCDITMAFQYINPVQYTNKTVVRNYTGNALYLCSSGSNCNHVREFIYCINIIYIYQSFSTFVGIFYEKYARQLKLPVTQRLNEKAFTIFYLIKHLKYIHCILIEVVIQYHSVISDILQCYCQY